ncbi:MAG: PTS system fructose-specific IIC component [Planctomycetota bacterium]|jgi:PTS system fructose-specific IIC component
MMQLSDADPLLSLALILLAGVALGGVAKRLHLPSITGQILAGILIGHSVLNVLSEESIEGLQPMTHFALGLMAVTVGAHLNLRRLKNAGKRLGVLVLFESLLTPVFVFVGLISLPGIDSSMAALLGTIAVSTAPATIVALVRETRSKGVFVKTLVAAVALNNMACILLFEVARAYAVSNWSQDDSSSLGADILGPALQLGKAVLLGTVAAVAADAVTRLFSKSDRLATSALAAILLTAGLADYFGISPLLACLFLGIVQTNINPAREKLVDRVFTDFEPAIMAVFFTLAGMHLDFAHIGTAGIAAVVFFVLRMLGKVLAVKWAMSFAGATDALRKNLGLALLPQAGLAIGLVLLIRDDPVLSTHKEAVSLFVAIVLTVVTMNELLGPIMTRYGLKRSGELGKDRTRLIDFLNEENITTELTATSKTEAIEELVDLLIHTHHLDNLDRDAFLESVLKRESEASTCLGLGFSLPHGILPEGERMVGVMGISRRGLDIPTPDNIKVHMMVLLATPPDERDRHLQVLATLVRVVGREPEMRDALFESSSPAHAYEILHSEEAETYNYFLEEE